MATQLLSIVFTDLVESTALKSLLPGNDIEERNRAYVDTIEEPHRQRIVAGLEAAGGRIVKNTGDGFLVIFPDPARAARWSMGVQRSHQEQPITTPLGPLELKIGLHLGAPLSNPHEPDDFIGHEVDFAARLCAAASRGQVLTSEPAAALIRAAGFSDLRIHPHGVRSLKGIGNVPVFELLGENDRPRPPAADAVSPSNLPPALAHFVGRDDLIKQIREHLRRGGVTVLKGEGGMGKTTLAVRAAHDALTAGELTGGAAWLNGESRPSLTECLRQSLRVFFGDRKEQEPIDVCAVRLADHLEKHDTLIIFDNFETIAHDPALIAWLGGLPSIGRVLITTREIPPGLPGRVVAVEELCPQEARNLFIGRAARGGAASGGQEALVDQICTAVGCQPLAIELLASRAALMPWGRLLERVLKSPEVIDAKRDPTRPDRHRSAVACIDLSFRDLSARASDLVRRMCVFPDGASATLVTAVTASQDWDDAAEELVAASVWRLTGRRFTTHPLVRQVALEKLQGSRGELERQAALAVTGFICQRKAPARQDQTAELKVIIDWVESELHNLAAVADFAFAAGEWECVLNLVTAIFDFFQVRGYWADAERLCTLALQSARRSNNRAGEARTLNFLGLISRQQGRWAEAESAHRDSWAIWSEIGDHRGEGHALKHLGRILQLRQHHRESAAICQQAFDLLHQVGDPLGEAKALTYLGNVYRFDGQFDKAIAVYDQALKISRDAGDRYDEGGILRRLGQIHHQQGRQDRAREALQESLAIWRSFDDRYNQAVILDDLGVLLRDEQRFSEAASMFEQSLAAFRQCGDRRKQGGTLLNLAKSAAAQGERTAALELGLAAITAFEHTEDAWALDRAREFVAAQRAGGG
jgi:class 3 adenylate cyclase/tetratricopeptide (TPR) repeat protein